MSPEESVEVQIQPGSLYETRFGIMKINDYKEGEEGKMRVFVNLDNSSKQVEFDLLKLQLTILRKVKDSPGKSTKDYWSSPEVSPPDGNESKDCAPVLEWPGQGQKQTDDESVEGEDDQQYGICEGLSLHRRRLNRCDDDEVVKFPTTSTINNPNDVRPGCNVAMWDPAACFEHLSWDPYASTLVS